MSTSLAVTAGDTQPLITITLYSDTALTTAIDLTTATSVVWKFAPTSATGGGVAASKTAAISGTPTTGITTWRHDGTLVAGIYSVHAVITWNDATVETTVGPVMTLTVNPTA